jgi:hypothetical protein
MTYTPRSYSQILTDAVTLFVAADTGVTDFNEGSVVRTLIEAWVLEMFRLYTDLARAVNDAQQNAAYETFGFSPLAAQPASGRVLFTLAAGFPSTQSITIPAGTVVTSSVNSSYIYTTQAAVTLSSTQPTAEVVVVAATAGALYNVGPNALDTVQVAGSQFVTVTNPRAFITGQDAESDLDRRLRFAQYLVGIHRGTRDAILYGLQTTTLTDPDGYVIERVAKAATIEYAPGQVHCAVHNGVGGTSTDLVNAAQTVVQGTPDLPGQPGSGTAGWAALGITVTTFAAQELTVDVSLTIEVQQGYIPSFVQTQVAQAVSTYIEQLAIGETLRIESLKQAARVVPGVLDLFLLTTPSANVTVAWNQLCVPGNIVITVNS